MGPSVSAAYQRISAFEYLRVLDRYYLRSSPEIAAAQGSKWFIAKLLHLNSGDLVDRLNFLR
jgi:hypothetical protein